MKSNRVELLSWHCANQENIEIDWPKVHRSLGTSHTKWLLQQDPSNCQIVLEKKITEFVLVAEFYQQRCYEEYQKTWSN